MSSEADRFSIGLLDEAKRFFEKAEEATEGEQNAYLHASLMVAFSALESHVNGIAEELSMRTPYSIVNKALLLEREVKLEKGRWVLGKEKFYRLEERVAFLVAEHSGNEPSSHPWWSSLLDGIKVRNSLVHPREALNLKLTDVKRFLEAIIDSLNDIYLAVFGKGHPSFNRGLQSTLTF